MTFDVDGWMIQSNPSPLGGGFTVISDTQTITHQMDYPGFTNNHAEILALACGVHLAQPHDTIRTDSQIALAWVKRRNSPKRPDLNPIIRFIARYAEDKHLLLEWIPREHNRAGIYNEQHHSGG